MVGGELHELQTAVSRGWKAVIEAWLTTAEASQDDNNAPDLADQIAIKLLAGPQLAFRAELAAALASLDAEIKAAEVSGDMDDDPDDDAPHPGRDQEDEIGANQGQEVAQDHRRLTARHSPSDPRCHASADAPSKAIGVLRSRIEELVADRFATVERNTLAWYDNLVHKYGTTLRQLESERDEAAARLAKHLKRLEYG